MKKSNKESKERTIVNQHKLEWYNQMKLSLKRERTLDDELLKFIEKNPELRVTSNSDQMTKKVR